MIAKKKIHPVPLSLRRRGQVYLRESMKQRNAFNMDLVPKLDVKQQVHYKRDGECCMTYSRSLGVSMNMKPYTEQDHLCLTASCSAKT